MALKQLFDHALDKVNGARAVQHALKQLNHSLPSQIIAVGKAASSMASGAWQYYRSSVPTLIISKYGHIDSDWYDCAKVTCIESAHPVPDQNSLKAGVCLLDSVASLGKKDSLLLLVSGGASALAEHLRLGFDLAQLQQCNQQLLASGVDIEAINQRRSELSAIKGGALLSHFKGRCVNVLAISDVAQDDIRVIGSGIGCTHLVKKADTNIQIVATNAMARQAIVNAAKTQGIMVRCNQYNMFDDVAKLANRIAEQIIDGETGIYIYGGEPTIVLPHHPGKGGRAQSLALILALLIKDRDNIEILVAGTDGSDGPTDATGAIVSADTIKGHEQQALDALQTASAYDFFAERNALLVTGPTGTNVMDVVIVWVK